jgi:hypothetical protein
VKGAAKKLVQSSSLFMSQCLETKEYPLPKTGRIRFYLLTIYGVFTADISEQEARSGRGTFSALFNLGDEVIAELRKLEEKS